MSFRFMSNRMVLVYVLLVLMFGYVAYKLYTVQIRRHDYLLKKARSKYRTSTLNRGKRGEIYDISGNLLVGNIPCSNVCADPSATGSEENCREMARFLASRLHIPENEIYRKLTTRTIQSRKADGSVVTSPRKFVILKSKVDFETSERLKEEVQKRKWKCIFFREDVKRFYPKGNMLANLLGFTSMQDGEIIPSVGLEMKFNSYIRSQNGVTRYERDRLGRPLDYGEKSVQEEQNGTNLYLTIREPIQAIVEEEIDKMMAEFRPHAAYVVMADPWTGEILAAAQRPTFDPNKREKIHPDAWRCRMAEDAMEPGSVMKPVVVAGALDRGIVTPEDRFDCEKGKWLYAKRFLHDSHNMGLLTVSEIIQHSSNIGTAKIAIKMGDKTVDEVIRQFGFGEKTGIPIKGETRGIYPKLSKWSMLSVSRIPIGQGIAVTPFQMVQAYCILANGGTPVRLKLVDRLENPETKEVIRFKNEYGKNIFRRPQTRDEIVAMMKKVSAADGTAKRAAVKGYYVAGKTGTAQKVEPGAEYIDSKGVKRRRKGVYSKKRYIANFIGFVPADKPRFVLLVTVDEPKTKNYYGGSVSGPYFSAIAERTLKYLNVPQDYDWEAQEATKKAAKKASKKKR